MFTAAAASGRKTRKAGTATVPTLHIFIHNSIIGDSLTTASAQCQMLAPRIIATHWLRPDSVEGANG